MCNLTSASTSWDWLIRLYPFVIVNSEDILHAEQVRALASSEDIVLTMRLDLVSLYRAQQHLAYLRRNQVFPEHIHVVAMGTGYSGELPVNSVKKVLGIKELHSIPDDPVADDNVDQSWKSVGVRIAYNEDFTGDRPNSRNRYPARRPPPKQKFTETFPGLRAAAVTDAERVAVLQASNQLDRILQGAYLVLGTEQSHNSADEATRDRRFQQLKVELHEQLISGMDFAVLRAVDPAVLRDEIRKGAEQLCGMHADF